MTVLKKNSILIFDTNIFLTGIDFNLIPSQLYTTPQVIEELEVTKYQSKNRTTLNRIMSARETGKLIVKSPSESYKHRVLEKSKETGDHIALSKTDIGIIALTLELKDTEKDETIIYTNDYSVENVCSHFNLSFKPIFKLGIKKKLFFETYCPLCKKIFESTYLQKDCSECGSRLKR
jgi:rRNA maturation endonuclease Nob1